MTFSIPAAGLTVQASTTVNVTWTETETGSGVASRSLQRQKGSVVTPGTCAGVTYANDGAADTGASPRSNTGLLGGQCYRWQLIVTDNVGNVAARRPRARSSSAAPRPPSPTPTRPTRTPRSACPSPAAPTTACCSTTPTRRATR